VYSNIPPLLRERGKKKKTKIFKKANNNIKGRAWVQRLSDNKVYRPAFREK